MRGEQGPVRDGRDLTQTPPDGPPLTARADGLLDAAAAVRAPFMAPRLQGEIACDGHIDLSVWGAGRVGRIRFSPLEGPFVIAPNRIVARRGGVWVAQSAPAVVVRGAAVAGRHPAQRPALWDPVENAAAEIMSEGGRWTCRLGWGAMATETRGPDLVVAAGADLEEAHRGLTLPVEQIVREADAYAARCDVLGEADPLLRGMAVQGAHAALSSIRRDRHGGFLGLTAGEAYSAPARTYYRDGYWTCQALLRLAPEAVAAEITLLAEGVRADGEAPSGLVLAPSKAWAAVRLASGAHQRPADWWSDHFDSPLLFVLMLADHARVARDDEIVRRHWPAVRAVFARYQGLARAGGGLPRKPRNDRDWADNVYREGLVAYDLGLWIGMLDAVERLGRRRDPGLAAQAAASAAAGRAAIEAALWRPSGWYADYASPDGFSEDHLALDSLTLLRFDAVSPQRANAVLDAVQARLETRHNPHQPYGDWGVMSVWPPYARKADTRAKSAFPFRYHNGGDWPWLDGLYAGELLRRGRPGWRYPLLRWWETCLARGWAGAVEHFSPPFGRGSLLQAWSSLPLAAALEHRAAVTIC